MTSVNVYVDARLLTTVQGACTDFQVVRRVENVVVGTAAAIDDQTVRRHGAAERLLDRHWLVYPNGDEEARRTAERCFFDVIADRYESEIDGSRNRENARLLLQCCDARAGAHVLDFGCGPGLIMRVRDDIRVVGCDVSETMRGAAEARGLPTVSPEELSALEGTFDVVIASYVLHLAVPRGDWVSAARCVHAGGRVAANVHKCQGVGAIEDAMRDASFTVVSDASFDHPVHGAIRTWEHKP